MSDSRQPPNYKSPNPYDTLVQAMNKHRSIAREQHGELIDHIVDQYQHAAAALNELFRQAPDTCYTDDRIGCCATPALPPLATYRGAAQYELIALAHAKGHGDTDATTCPYHHRDEGCTLGDLKPPVCLTHYCRGALRQTDYDTATLTQMLTNLLTSEAPQVYVDQIQRHIRHLRRQLPIINEE